MKTKVDQSGSNLIKVTLFDQDTHEEEKIVVEDYGYRHGDSPFLPLDTYTLDELNALYDAPIDESARKAWLHYHGIIGIGDCVVVVRGRKYPKGTTGTVVGFWDYRDQYGHTLTEYAKLDTGISVPMANLALV